MRAGVSKARFAQEFQSKKEKYYRIAYSYAKNEPDALDIVGQAAYRGLKNLHTLICTLLLTSCSASAAWNGETETPPRDSPLQGFHLTKRKSSIIITPETNRKDRDPSQYENLTLPVREVRPNGQPGR